MGDGQAPLARLIKTVDRSNKWVAMPKFLLRMVLNFKFNLITYPPGKLDHLKYTCLVGGQRAKDELGFKTRTNMMKTVKSVKK